MADERSAGVGRVGGTGGVGGVPSGPGGPGGIGGPGGDYIARPRGWWEHLAPWLAGAGMIALLAVPIGGYVVIHNSQQNSQAQVQELVNAFKCQQKAFEGLLLDVPLAFSGDRNAHDYAKIARNCKVPQTPSGP